VSKRQSDFECNWYVKLSLKCSIYVWMFLLWKQVWCKTLCTIFNLIQKLLLSLLAKLRSGDKWFWCEVTKTTACFHGEKSFFISTADCAASKHALSSTTGILSHSCLLISAQEIMKLTFVSSVIGYKQEISNGADQWSATY